MGKMALRFLQYAQNNSPVKLCFKNELSHSDSMVTTAIGMNELNLPVVGAALCFFGLSQCTPAEEKEAAF